MYLSDFIRLCLESSAHEINKDSSFQIGLNYPCVWALSGSTVHWPVAEEGEDKAGKAQTKPMHLPTLGSIPSSFFASIWLLSHHMDSLKLPEEKPESLGFCSWKLKKQACVLAFLYFNFSVIFCNKWRLSSMLAYVYT